MPGADTDRGASALWMLDQPSIDWGALMPDLSNQRRSENIEDVRGQPWTLPMYAYRYGGIESSPAQILMALAHGLAHPLTRQQPPALPPGEQADSPMARALGLSMIR